MLVDTHCHLDFPDFKDDLDEVVARARRAGVSPLLSIGTYVSRFPQLLGSEAPSARGRWVSRKRDRKSVRPGSGSALCGLS